MMNRPWYSLSHVRRFMLLAWLMAFALVPIRNCSAAASAAETAIGPIRLDLGHPWRPPFGLDRIGRPLTAVVEIADDQQAEREYVLVGSRDGQEIGRSTLNLSPTAPHRGRATFDPWPTELVLLVQSEQGTFTEVARLAVTPPALEADAIARPDRLVNPVDLGTVLPPSDWLLLSEGQGGEIRVAAISRTAAVPDARVIASFDSNPAATTTATLNLARDGRLEVRLPLPPTPATADRDALQVRIQAPDGAELWHKTIETMVVHHPPALPAFGATAIKLRYDPPISLLAADGTLSSMPYADGWDPQLQDVVVTIPNGSRFVFWRGSSYIPFWASRHNVGFNYEWAEGTPPTDAVDCVEPLMDKELRYSRVEIVESTPARVHVRWRYQSCDFNYKVWGDTAVEDYFFYPDGFGTRVLTLQSDPKTADYELSEFIILTPQSTYPMSVLPSNALDIVFLDGQKREVAFPFFDKEQGEKKESRDMPAVFRVRLHKDEPLAAIYFNPLDRILPAHYYGPFFDNGELVTLFYWGSHWPLARGKTTGYVIDSRVDLTPCHNSIVSWAKNRPTPLRAAQYVTIDALGRSKPMQVQTWAWLIGMSDASDEGLLDWAQSFTTPPSLTDLRGARLSAEPYCPERRSLRLVVEQSEVAMTIASAPRCVHPVFELADAPGALVRVRLAGHDLDPSQYAWDGKTLWIGATLRENVPLLLQFDAVKGIVQCVMR